MTWNDLTEEEKVKFERVVSFCVNMLKIPAPVKENYYQECWMVCLQKLHKFDRSKGAVGTFMKWQCRSAISEAAKKFVKEGFTFRGTSQWVTRFIFDDSKIRGQGPRGYRVDLDEYFLSLESPHEARRKKLTSAEY